MKQKIQVLLNTTGVFSHYCGYRYFISAVELALEDPTRLQCIHKEIYVTVASEFSTTVSSVERNIRTVRDVMMRNGGHHLLVEMTGCPVWEDKTPYPKDLIAIFCEYLLNRYPLISAMQVT